VFEVDLLKSQEINLDYILGLIFEKNKQVTDKRDLIEDARRAIRGSIGNRAKESLLVEFINKTDFDEIDDKASLIDAFYIYARAEQRREVEELISSENLNSEAAKRYISTSIKREFASDNGADLNALLPNMSPLNRQFRPLKQRVFEKIVAFVEKFGGVGGQI
jgi:type I restriction enzyme R subunit